MNKCTGVLDTFHGGGKEEPDLSNTQSTHTWFEFISVDENTVMSRFAVPPGGNSVDVLMMHATCPTQITGCIECSNSRGIDGDYVQNVEEWRG